MGDMLPLPATPSNAAEAVEAIARTQAIMAWAKEREAPLRSWLQERGLESEALTGGTFNLPTEFGRAQFTDPDPIVTVKDPDAFGEWATDNAPDLAPQPRTRIAVESMSPTHADLLASVIEDDGTMPQGDYDYRLGLLLKVLRVDRDVVFPEAVGKLADHDRVKTKRPEPEARWLDPDTGEYQIIPGVTVTWPDRQFRVTVDKPVKTRLLNELQALTGPPELAGPDRPEEGSQ